MNIPELPVQTNPFLWGAAAGAVALAFVGFNWGGWVTGGAAEKLASERAEAAIVSSLTPVCVARFRASKAEVVRRPRASMLTVRLPTASGGCLTGPARLGLPKSPIGQAVSSARSNGAAPCRSSEHAGLSIDSATGAAVRLPYASSNGSRPRAANTISCGYQPAATTGGIAPTPPAFGSSRARK